MIQFIHCFALDITPLYYTNYDLENVVTPVKPDILEQLLVETGYDHEETKFVVDGFRHGFDLGYQGQCCNIQRRAPNLKLRVGNKTILWNKVMKEVKLGRFAGPYEVPPFEDFIQSPIGLVPKDGSDTRLIFHLSYPRTGASINSETPKEACSIKYPDFSDAIRICLQLGAGCKIGKSDMKSAFRNLGIKVSQFMLLILAATSPFDGKLYYFVDKCLPFGASISCSHFQRVSNCIAHIVRVKSQGQPNINYLDDYLFAHLLQSLCDLQISTFLDICEKIGFPVALDKTYWATTLLPFLGFLIDTVRQLVSIPEDKVQRAQVLIQEILFSKKTTVHKLQRLCGYLNFLCRCIVPGRAFTRRLYSMISPTLSAHHHLNVNHDMKEDLKVWLDFLDNPIVYCRPFMDYSTTLVADVLDWYTDASGTIGCGGYRKNNWFQYRWDPEFIRSKNPSIEYQELFAVTLSIRLWLHRYPNARICLFCDNETVVKQLKNSSSSCKNCMVLIRMIIGQSLKYNSRVFGRWVDTKSNNLADALSRFEMTRFWKDVEEEERTMNPVPDQIPVDMDPWVLWVD